MKAYIGKAPVSGTMSAPPSKSVAHRLLICSGLCQGKSVVGGISNSDDINATLDCLRDLGADFSVQGDVVTIQGADMFKRKNVCINCRESGSTLRFFIPLCLLSDGEITIKGSERLLSRPLDIYQNICSQQGIEFSNNGKEIRLRGKLQGGEFKLPGNISSQFISGLLFALPLLECDSTINILPPLESGPYINLTIEALKQFGINITWQRERVLYIEGRQRYKECESTVEGDYSNSAFFEALNYLGGKVTVEGLKEDSLQGDKIYREFFDKLERGTPTIHISDCPDLGPVLFSVAAFHNGGVFTGTRRLKIKESDRGKAMAQELQKFGVSVKIKEDTIIVYPTEFHSPSEILNGHNDHRIVMAISVLLTAVGGTIDGAEAVKKSMPDFFDKLKLLGAEVKLFD